MLYSAKVDVLEHLECNAAIYEQSFTAYNTTIQREISIKSTSLNCWS